MTWDDLKGKPRFEDVAAEFIAFATGAEWIIHNAPFDIGFLDAELARVSLPACAEIHAGVIEGLYASDLAYLQRLYEKFNAGEDSEGVSAPLNGSGHSRMTALGEA